MAYFHELIKHPLILQNLEELSYFEATDIQREGIPLIREGRDIFGVAQTGTGKTGSFCLPLIEKLLNSEASSIPRVLILVPTRELCMQIHDNIQAFAKGSALKSCAIYGGVKHIFQTEEINQGVNFIVATPGRLLDLLKKEMIKLEGIEVLVLDEADRMLDIGLIGDLNQILKFIPNRQQTLLYSATVPESIRELSKNFQKNPSFIEVAKNTSVNSDISQYVFHCEPNQKLPLLKNIIMEEAFGSVLIFTNTKERADEVALYLTRNSIDTKAIHSDKKQAEREKIIRQFADGKINVLVATDLVARGIDIETIGMVISFDLPLDPESYVHRVGRTGRAGRSGLAFSFCAKSDLKLLQKIESFTNSKIIQRN
ncbi:DEAD/DEAH box helicase [Peredibacter starrii]|uniref:DEAD/DEAH box helicase n=1 Tax=Peredibacter starrii TaxID=28202 RepID=A0AAX4HTY7_9BACT|nr:DEAD/DEAH box helicase [Peredibacter starrii]WPU66543.1 DEAD/DEAH box helicase [Peredibacter starrii]